MLGLTLKWTIRAILVGFLCLGLANCTMLGLNYSSLETDSKPLLSPELTSQFNPAETRATLEQELYGPWPEGLPVSAGEPRMIDDNYLEGRGTLQEVMVTIGAPGSARTFPVVIALPNKANDTPVPLIISQTFVGNCAVFPDQPIIGGDGQVCEGPEVSGMLGFVATQIFGTYIAYAPVDRYFDAGIAYASMDGSGFVPDKDGVAQDVMSQLAPGTKPTGTLMSWAYAFSAVADVLGADPRVDDDSIAAMGHSRYGKSALIAAAWSDSIAAAIAHQSGFAGGSSSRSTTGETLLRMVNGYPHWLRPGLGEDLESGTELTLDQHYLLALAAPKPIFLGNGRRDVWSDPNSSFRIAQAADTIYKANGAKGLTAENMRDFRADADIAYWLRIGGHSVVSEDLAAFIAITSAHFNTASPRENTLQSAQ
jgi:hypothetical protein